LKVYLIPTDESGDDIKATGTVVIEAFDLAAQDTRVGRWEFSSAQLKPMWNGHGMLYEFIIPCPWQTLPQHEKVTIKVSFTDALTGRTFDAQTIASVKLPHS
jgi:hypothetical protein